MSQLPNFIVAGFPKCGTTSLFAYLNEHPEIFIPERKELNYFTYPIISKFVNGPNDKRVSDTQVKSWDEYLEYYSKVPKKSKAIGDISPSYINFPECFKDIKDKLGDPKVIIIIRNPIKRAFSNYMHLLRKGREQLSFHDALLAEEKRKEEGYSPFWYYKSHSIYAHKIVAAKENFTNILVLTQERLATDRLQVISEVYDFLGVDSSFIPKNLNERFNQGGVYRKNILTNFVSNAGSFRVLNNKFFKQLRPLKNFILKAFKKPSPIIEERTKAYLSDFFHEDFEKLSRMNDIDVSHWKTYFKDA